MKRFMVLKGMMGCICFFLQVNVKGQDPSRFFPDSLLMTIGSYYYPEQWDRQYWETDIRKMAEVGFEFTHFGEFAWAFIEPEEGKFDFSWLDEVVALANNNGMKVIMCTSSATPPAWLVQKHPEILMENAEARTMQHGSRQHISWSSAVYRKYVTRMVEALGKHYGTDKRIWGWQLDNEPSHYGQYDYSPAAQESFHNWLKKKYIDIDSLNTVWGTAFWSIRYQNFDQVRIPNQKELIAQPSPHAVLDFKRFSAEECNDFLGMQYGILRKYIHPGQWITTNLMPEHAEVDPTKINSLDFVSYTKYLVAGYDKGVGKLGFRMGSSGSIGFANDLFRSLNGITGVMELQPGQVNWGKFNSQPLPGAVRMWIWHAFAGGNKFVCNYRFDRPLTGGEQYHFAIMDADKKTISITGKEYVQTISEIKNIRRYFNPGANAPATYQKRSAAILYNSDNRWEMDNQPQTNQWDFMLHLKKYYNALKQMGAPVDIITEDKNFDKYPFLIAPAYQLLDSQLVNRWKAYVEKGGHLLLTCRTGQKDRNGKLWQMHWAEPVYNLVGGEILFYDLLPDTVEGKIKFSGKTFEWNNWGDILKPSGNTESWAMYTTQFYAGNAAVLHRKLGKGTVTYVGADTDDGQLEKAVLEKVYQQAGIEVAQYPEGVVIDWRVGFWIGVNYSDHSYKVNLSKDASVFIGDTVLNPASVIVWKQ